MMQGTWHLLLILAHALLLAGILTGESQTQWLAPPLTVGSAFVFALASIYANSVEVATQTGIETTSEPAIGIYALVLAAIAFIVALAMTFQFLPVSGDSYAT